MKQFLFHQDDLQESTSKGIDIDDHKLFAVKKDGQIYVYKNSCPHLGVNLDWMPDQFLDSENVLIQCAMHGALFKIEDGLCIAGPCNGASLSSVEFEVNDKGEVVAEL